MKIRRTEFLFIYHTSGNFLDIKFHFDPTPLKEGQVFAIAILLGQEVIIEQSEIQVLFGVPTTKWINPTQTSIEPSRLEFFVENGLLLSDDTNNERATVLKYRDQALKEGEWNIYAALQHFSSRWTKIDGSLPFFVPPQVDPLANIKDELARMKSKGLGIPDHFHRHKGIHEMPLAHVKDDNELYKILDKRKTTRNFDTTRPLDFGELSKLMHFVFGYQGIYNANGKYDVLKKNHPSTGALHPIETYLLALNIDGIEPGLYHYQTSNNNLNQINAYTFNEVKEVAKRLACQQGYTSDAAALFILTSRFHRSFWKYRKHPKILNYQIRESAHISQNFYLVCSEMGLGAFTTTMNEIDADNEIGIDGFNEGSLVLLGCGHANIEENVKYPELNFKKKSF